MIICIALFLELYSAFKPYAYVGSCTKQISLFYA